LCALYSKCCRKDKGFGGKDRYEVFPQGSGSRKRESFTNGVCVQVRIKFGRKNTGGGEGGLGSVVKQDNVYLNLQGKTCGLNPRSCRSGNEKSGPRVGELRGDTVNWEEPERKKYGQTDANHKLGRVLVQFLS